jgi:menaquinone-dependent protoporphyrinogen IX oxidase
MKVLIAYGTTEGQTEHIADELAAGPRSIGWPMRWPVSRLHDGHACRVLDGYTAPP